MNEEQPDDGAYHLSSLELVAAADGELDEAALSHLRQCPRCRQRVAALRNLQQALRRRLYRAFCPTTDQLVDYCQGLLPLAQHRLIARHITTCPHCSAEVDLLMQRDPLIDRLLLSDLLSRHSSRYAP